MLIIFQQNYLCWKANWNVSSKQNNLYTQLGQWLTNFFFAYFRNVNILTLKDCLCWHEFFCVNPICLNSLIQLEFLKEYEALRNFILLPLQNINWIFQFFPSWLFWKYLLFTEDILKYPTSFKRHIKILKILFFVFFKTKIFLKLYNYFGSKIQSILNDF